MKGSVRCWECVVMCRAGLILQLPQLHQPVLSENTAKSLLSHSKMPSISTLTHVDKQHHQAIHWFHHPAFDDFEICFIVNICIHLPQRSFRIFIFPTRVLHICILLLIHYPFRVLSNVSVLSSTVFCPQLTLIIFKNSSVSKWNRY